MRDAFSTALNASLFPFHGTENLALGPGLRDNPVQGESTMKKHAFQVKRKMPDDICICIIRKDVLYE